MNEFFAGFVVGVAVMTVLAIWVIVTEVDD